MPFVRRREWTFARKNQQTCGGCESSVRFWSKLMPIFQLWIQPVRSGLKVPTNWWRATPGTLRWFTPIMDAWVWVLESRLGTPIFIPIKDTVNRVAAWKRRVLTPGLTNYSQGPLAMRISWLLSATTIMKCSMAFAPICPEYPWEAPDLNTCEFISRCDVVLKRFIYQSAYTMLYITRTNKYSSCYFFYYACIKWKRNRCLILNSRWLLGQ